MTSKQVKQTAFAALLALGASTPRMQMAKKPSSIRRLDDLFQPQLLRNRWDSFMSIKGAIASKRRVGR